MKTIALLLSISLGYLSSAQKLEVPAEVLLTFETKYPTGEVQEWSFEEEDNSWEVEFILDSQELEAEFDPAGTWIKTERELSRSEIPLAVMSQLEALYPEAELEEAEWVEEPSTTYYELEVLLDDQGQTELWEMRFSTNGDFLGKKLEEIEGEEIED